MNLTNNCNVHMNFEMCIIIKNNNKFILEVPYKM